MPPQETTFGGKFFDEMRLLLEETFGVYELKTLCMDLDVIPDNIPGDTLRAKIQGLLDEFRRIGRLPELVEYCRPRRAHTKTGRSLPLRIWHYWQKRSIYLPCGSYE